VAVWVLAVVRFSVFGAVGAEFVAAVGCGMAMAGNGSGCEKQGWEVCRGAVSRLSRVCRRFRDAGCWFGAGDIVTVNDFVNVDVVDGGCAGDNATGSSSVDRLGAVSLRVAV
jgi:hypothetical protein